jgi:hypothetical protein
MLTGPDRLGFMLQLAVALGIGLFDGLWDVHSGRRPLRIEVGPHPKGKRRPCAYLVQLLDRIFLPLATAVALSLAFQYVLRGTRRFGSMLAFAIVLVGLPYLIARELGSRIDLHWLHWHRRHQHRA